jgi:hypothetical protein
MPTTGGTVVRGSAAIRAALVLLLLLLSLTLADGKRAIALSQALPGEHDPAFGNEGITEIHFRPASADIARAGVYMGTAPNERALMVGSAAGDFGLFLELNNGSNPPAANGRIIADFSGRTDTA